HPSRQTFRRTISYDPSLRRGANTVILASTGLGAAQIVPDPQRGLAPRGSDVRGTCCPHEIRAGGDFLWCRANDCRERPRADEVATLTVYAPEPCADSVFPSPSAPSSMCSPMLHERRQQR